MKTAEEFKAFMGGEAGKLADALLVATAFAQLERERVDGYVEPIFAAYGFRDGRTGEPLKHSRELYRVDDLQDDRVNEFYAACDAAHRERGFTGPEGHCPALVAENAVIQAERALLEAAGRWLGFDAGLVYGENRKKMLDLLLGANAIKYRKGKRA
jgi:hypothetical protein